MEAKVEWKGKLSFNGSADTGFSLPLDARTDAGGEGEGFRPMELLAIGLAGCTAMDVISILGKKQQDVTAFRVEAHIDRAAEHPRVFTRAMLEYFVTGRQVDEAAVARSIELSITKYCPAYAMLSKAMPIDLIYHLLEAQEDGTSVLVKSGTYTPPGEGIKE